VNEFPLTLAGAIAVAEDGSRVQPHCWAGCFAITLSGEQFSFWSRISKNKWKYIGPWSPSPADLSDQTRWRIVL